jgi:SNF2 family DNA or RNA helicase
MKTYGTIETDKKGRKFILKVDPHVAIRLKRVFPRIEKSTIGEIRISITDDTARDLEWFMTRYPLEAVNGAREAILGGADRHRERQANVENLLEGRGTPLPFGLALPLREYQEVGARMALETRGLLIADDLGLGKTAEAIAMFANPDTLPALFVTLTHLPRQMQEQIFKFAPHLYTHILTKGTPYPLGSRLFGRYPDVIISNYHKLDGWAESLAGKVSTVIFDEVQELRHSGTLRYDAAALIRSKAKYCCALSATPLHNYGGEMHHVLDVVSPGSLGSWEEFKTEWCQTDASGGREKVLIKDPKAFGYYLRESGLMLRRTRKDVGREIKEPIIIPHTVDMDKETFQRMSKGCEELARIILERSEEYRGQKMRVSQEFDMRMRQATGISKAAYVAEFVKLLLESEEKIIVFAWHREVYSILSDLLKDYKPVMYTGSESPVQKNYSFDQFVKGEARIMLLSLRAGAGIDGLQDVCDVCVFSELDWSPAVHSQDIGRLHRDKSDPKYERDNPVVAYYLISEEGSDPFITDILGIKKQQSDLIRDPNRPLVEKLQTDPEHIKKLAMAYMKKGGHGPNKRVDMQPPIL